MSRMGEVICFDTTPLIWGVRGESDRGDEHWIGITQRYIKYIKDTKKQILIPAPSLTEYLIGATETELRLLEILKVEAQIGVLDLSASVLAAQLQRRGRVRQIQDDFGIDRACVKADAQIIAIAITHHASRIITHNQRHFTALADGRIPISEVPDMAEQTDFSFAFDRTD